MTVPASLTTISDQPSPDQSSGPFEGPEKLLELWFAPSLDDLPTAHACSSNSNLRIRQNVAGSKGELMGLRRVPREVWEEMLSIVQCKVLSVVEGEELDAYLLSESSLFVAPHLLILKTCGTTLNLLGLYRIIEIARQYCGFTTVWRCFYSRKSFFFPERQSGPHKDWRDEVNFLDSVFGSSGSAYTVGPMNRDHWLLYLTSPNTQPLLPTDKVPLSPTIKSIRSFPSQQPQSLSTTYKDHTLEILMSHLDTSSREPFFYPQSGSTSGHDLGRQTTSLLGIDQLFPSSETVIDSFGFEPCGYSANAVIGTGQPENVYTKGKPGGGYFTIHVTPEEGWSYASFECNVPLPLDRPSTTSRPDLSTLIKKVVSIFKPNRLSITLFVSTPQGSTTPALAVNGGGGVDETEQKAWEAFGSDLLGEEFARKDRIGYEFDGYDLVFACFEKKGWVEPKKAKSIGGL